METKSSRLSGFYRKTWQERLAIISQWSGLSLEDERVFSGEGGLSTEDAVNMIENVIGIYGLPFGIATNFLINQKDYLIPMVIEEPSVVAAVSFAAKLFREGGGFTTSSDDPIMIGQLQLLDIEHLETAKNSILENKQMLLAKANEVGGSIVKRGGGSRDIEVYQYPNTSVGDMLIVHLLYDTRDAMGANAVNTAAEYIAPLLEEITGGRVNLRILSNLTDQRKARAAGVIPVSALATGEMSGEDVIQSLLEAATFAEVDPYRATTHNKGIMNGIDAVVMATGNDWRAVEAGAHAYAARDGRYTSLTRWWQDEGGNLCGSIELPLAVGIVGGATRVHPTAQLALKILGIETAQQLSEIMAAVGLAQNFAAIRALATDGIQSGHMRMHARQLAVAAGASNEEVPAIVNQMIADKNIRLEYAKTLVNAHRSDRTNA
ncbi:MAG: hydroxymethylglutaryl-CoA reductase, degradative [Anaerolineaceae bacterium]|nr:hydroxymethylglutaryl-CoA reductase, degradative [Anaerolineaceae bacterium]